MKDNMTKIIKEIKSIGIDELKDDRLYIIRVDTDNRDNLYKLRDELREIVPKGIVTNVDMNMLETDSFKKATETIYTDKNDKESLLDRFLNIFSKDE